MDRGFYFRFRAWAYAAVVSVRCHECFIICWRYTNSFLNIIERGLCFVSCREIMGIVPRMKFGTAPRLAPESAGGVDLFYLEGQIVIEVCMEVFFILQGQGS